MDALEPLDLNKGMEIGVTDNLRMVPDRQTHLPTFMNKTKLPSLLLTTNPLSRGGVVWADMGGEEAELVELLQGVEPLDVEVPVGVPRLDEEPHDHLCAGGGKTGTRWAYSTNHDDGTHCWSR